MGHHLGEGASDLGGIRISPDGSAMSSGDGGVCQLAQDRFHWMEWSRHLVDGVGCHQLPQGHIFSFFVFSFFSLSAFLLFSFLDSENILFHPVKTILDYSIKFLGSPHITNAHFLKKCDQYCLK